MAKESSIYSLLKAKFLIDDDALKTWKFIIFVFSLAMLMVYFNHNYDEKNYRITSLTNEVKELRSKFVDTRSELMKLKMESTFKKNGNKTNFAFNRSTKKNCNKKTSRKKFYR